MALPFVRFQMFKNGSDEVITEVLTDANGYFTIRRAAPGRYELAARYPSFRSLFVPVRVIRKSKAQKKRAPEIIIVLNGLMDKPCGGGTAYLGSKALSKAN